MMAIHHTLQFLTTTYCDDTTHMFTNCLNVLYLLNTQVKHPTMHDSHPHKTIFNSMVRMLQSRTQTSTLQKVKAPTTIDGIEQAYALAKWGCKLNHRNALAPNE